VRASSINEEERVRWKTDGFFLRRRFAPVDVVETLEREAETVSLDGSRIDSHIAPYELVKTMRASILVLGPLLSRLGHAQVSLPGGCAIGDRPVDLHLRALEKMGAEIVLEHGYIEARASRLRGAEIYFDTVTVTGTENIMMAACLAEGTTVLKNAAREPEVFDLGELLNRLGARVAGHGSSTIVIHGVDALHGGEHRIIPDRIETGTYVCAGAITGGDITISNTRSDFLERFLDVMAATGLPLERGSDHIRVLPHRGLRAKDIETQPHPGFPTDMQAQFMAVMTQAHGRSLITESIFENRFMHVGELHRMAPTSRYRATRRPPPGRRRSPAPRSWRRTCAPPLRWCWQA